MKVLFVNLDKKYLYVKEYDNNVVLLNIIRKIYYNPHPHILTLFIDGIQDYWHEPIIAKIKYYFDSLGYRIYPSLGEYIKYPVYKPKNNSKKGEH